MWGMKDIQKLFVLLLMRRDGHSALSRKEQHPVHAALTTDPRASLPRVARQDVEASPSRIKQAYGDFSFMAQAVSLAHIWRSCNALPPWALRASPACLYAGAVGVKVKDRR